MSDFRCLKSHETSKTARAVIVRCGSPSVLGAGTYARTLHSIDARSGNTRARVVVVQADRLEEIHRNIHIEREELLGDNRASDEGDEEDE